MKVRESSAPLLPSTAQPIERLYREHAPFVFRALRALGVREADLPDVVHDVFVTVHQRADADVYSSMRAWVHGIALRTAANYRRRARHQRETLVADLPESLTSGEPGAALDLLRALSVLDEDQRAVFVLYELEELSMPEVAEALACPPTTAYSRLYAARRAIRKLYSEKGGRE